MLGRDRGQHRAPCLPREQGSQGLGAALRLAQGLLEQAWLLAGLRELPVVPPALPPTDSGPGRGRRVRIPAAQSPRCQPKRVRPSSPDTVGRGCCSTLSHPACSRSPEPTEPGALSGAVHSRDRRGHAKGSCTPRRSMHARDGAALPVEGGRVGSAGTKPGGFPEEEASAMGQDGERG